MVDDVSGIKMCRRSSFSYQWEFRDPKVEGAVPYDICLAIFSGEIPLIGLKKKALYMAGTSNKSVPEMAIGLTQFGCWMLLTENRGWERSTVEPHFWVGGLTSICLLKRNHVLA